MERRSSAFVPITIQDTCQITPDNPLFWKFPMNVVIMTKYGRFVYMRHGNGDRSSSFLATLSTIISKLQLSFGQQKRAQIHSIHQCGVQMHIRRKQNYIYIYWCIYPTPESIISATLCFLHHQLTSCLTAQVTALIEQHQTYDPTVNFARGRAHHTLLQHALQNARFCLPIPLDALPILPLASPHRISLQSLLKDNRMEGVQCCILMTVSQVIGVYKKRDATVSVYDVLLFSILLQSQSALAKTEVWFPICLPGMDAEQMLFCYLHYISQEVVIVMVANQSNIFSEVSETARRIQTRMVEIGLLKQYPQNHYSESNALTMNLKNPFNDKTQMLLHYVIRQTAELSQMVMSGGKCMGKNQGIFQEYVQVYGELIMKINKEGFHGEIIGDYLGGCHVEGKCLIMFVASALCDMEECRNISLSLLKYYKEEQSNLFIGKMH